MNGSQTTYTPEAKNHCKLSEYILNFICMLPPQFLLSEISAMPMLTLPPSVALTSSNNPSALSNHSAGPVAHNSTSRPGVGEWEESDCTMPEIVRKLSPGCLVPYYCLWQVWGLLEFVFFFSFYLDVTKQSWDEHLGWIIGINTVNIKTWQHWAHHSLGSLITPDDGSTAKGGITTD